MKSMGLVARSSSKTYSPRTPSRTHAMRVRHAFLSLSHAATVPSSTCAQYCSRNETPTGYLAAKARSSSTASGCLAPTSRTTLL